MRPHSVLFALTALLLASGWAWGAGALEVEIISPKEYSSFDVGEEITFEATATDPTSEKALEKIKWAWDFDDGTGDDYYDPSYGITTTSPSTYTTTTVDAWRMLYEDPPHAYNQWRKRTGDPSVLRFDDL